MWELGVSPSGAGPEGRKREDWIGKVLAMSDSQLQNYSAWLSSLKERVRYAQSKAVLAVNRELILLYWNIGREILDRQAAQGWGAKVIDQLATDLRREFPDMKGFSSRNLKYMRSFAEAWPDTSIVQTVSAQLSLVDEKLKSDMDQPSIGLIC